MLQVQQRSSGDTMFSGQSLNLKSYDESGFIEQFGGLYEHSPWVAKGVWDEIDLNDDILFESLFKRLRTIVDDATDDRKLALLRAHPELAGKAATEGTLTAESTDEQSRARLDLCTPEEFKKFHQLNSAYNEKFEFPFIMAVRNSTRAEILKAFETRLQNERQQELVTALEQVHQIAQLRLEAFVLAEHSSGEPASEPGSR